MSRNINVVAENSQADTRASVAVGSKRSYTSPQLRRLGSVRELTLGLTTGPFEVSMMGA